MYKKVTFEVCEHDEDRQNVINTVLTYGYAFMNIVEKRHVDDTIMMSFAVSKHDLQDLRHDVGILANAGYCVKEEQPYSGRTSFIFLRKRGS